MIDIKPWRDNRHSNRPEAGIHSFSRTELDRPERSHPLAPEKPSTDQAATGGWQSVTIRSRIVVLVLVVFIPAAAAMAWLFMHDMQVAREGAHGRIERATLDVQRGVGHVLGVSGMLLGRLADRPAVRALDSRACDSTMADVFAATPGIVGLELRDAQGREICACDRDGAPRQTDAPGDWLARALQSSRLTASLPYFSELNHRQHLMLAYPVVAANGSVAGVIAAPLDLIQFGDRLLQYAPGDTVLSLADPSGIELLSTARTASFVGEDGAAGLWNRSTAKAGEGYERFAGYDGVPRLYGFATLPELGWRVAAGLPESDVLASYRSAVVRTAALGTGILLAAIVLAWRVGQSITSPIAELQRSARRVANGEGNDRAVEQGPPEIRAVMHDFNRMLDVLALSRARLQGVFDSAPDAIVSADGSQHIVLANRAAARLFKWPLDLLVGAPLNNLIPARQRAAHAVAVRDFGNQEAAVRPIGHRPTLQALRSDGTEFPIEASISHIELGTQRIYTAVLRDVTERERAHAILVASKATLAAALASMSDAVYVCDAKGSFVEANDAFVAFYRCVDHHAPSITLEALASKVAFLHIDGSPVPDDQQPGPRALRGEMASGAEFLLRRRDTGEQWIGSFSFAPLRGDDRQVFGAVVTARDVTSIRQTQRELEASHGALRRLVAALDKAGEHERKRIARELHDDLQQTLAAIKLEAVAASRSTTEVTAAGLERIHDLAGAALRSTRRIIEALRPQLLEELGLVAALEALAAQFVRRTGVPCEVLVDPPAVAEREIAPDTATCLFRVAQEALNNVEKHARARTVLIRLTSPSTGCLRLEVNDDGVGIAPLDGAMPGSFGLLGMRERVLSAGGTLHVGGMPDCGTFVEAEVPLEGLGSTFDATHDDPSIAT